MMEKFALVAAVAVGCFCFCSAGFAGEGGREEGLALLEDGNYREAAAIFRRLALAPDAPPRAAAENLRSALECWLAHLHHPQEAMRLLDDAVRARPKSWRVLAVAAEALAGGNQRIEVRRGESTFVMPAPVLPRRGDEYRAQAIRLLRAAVGLWGDGEDAAGDAAAAGGGADDPARDEEKLGVLQQLAAAILSGREGGRAWRLTALTDLHTAGRAASGAAALSATESSATESSTKSSIIDSSIDSSVPHSPAADISAIVLSAPADEADSLPAWAVPMRGAPVGADGEPVSYRVPASWDSAASDGERWRWALARMGDLGARGAAEADLLLGEFLLSQFGVQTMLEWQGARSADIAGEDGMYAVRTLRDDETIARLADGLRRFAMPPEFNHIHVLRRVAESGEDDARGRARALLASIFENRQQYPKAAGEWRRALEDSAPGGADARAAAEALERITAARGMLEPGKSAPAGERSVLSYLFRNGGAVDFVARRLDEDALLADIRAALRSGGEEFFDKYLHRQPEALGQFVFSDEGKKYLGGVAAEWSVVLEALPDHFSRRVDVDVPLLGAGCYLVEAAMRGGNVSRIVLWIADTALVRKNAHGEQVLFVADAAAGTPAPGAEVAFTGVRTEFDPASGRRARRLVEFSGTTDADGLLFVPSEKMADTEWLITATTREGGRGYLGFEHVWAASSGDEGGAPATAFVLVDRPAYRPGQTVRFKAWVGRAGYAPRPGDSFAGRAVEIAVYNPRGETVHQAVLAADAYGGVDGEFTPAHGAPLGQYSLSARSGDAGGGAAFRVEEYRKPEFTVALDAPEKAILLGDRAQLTVRAAYYYGAPVAGGRVQYRVLRVPHRAAVEPPWRWGWLYGAEAWDALHAASDDAPSLRAAFMPFAPAVPEEVAEGEGELDAEGAFRFAVDTAPAKEFFGNEDHEYQISFEVTDASRRVIAGTGSVVAAREPFAVMLWGDRGYYRAGGEIRVGVRAVLPRAGSALGAGGGVAAEGTAVLHRIAHDAEGRREETEAGRWDFATDDGGEGELRFRAGGAGQYRLAVSLREAGSAGADSPDGAAKSVSAEMLLTVRGEAGEGDFRFPALELAADGREYAPGDVLRLAVNSAHADGVVLLFPRAEREGRPQVLRLREGTAFVEIPVGREDRPNFFCEAVAVFGGDVHSALREIFVPPADRTLRAEVTADKENYLPGEKAAFRIRVTDADGEPLRGQCAVSLYDKAVEAFAGGAGTGDIRAAFWGWKRFHGIDLRSSLAKTPYAVSREGDAFWQPVGAFGSIEADWNGGDMYTNGIARPQLRMRSMGGGGAVAEGRVLRAAADTGMMTAMAVPAAAPVAEMAYAGGAADEAGIAGADGWAEAAVRGDFADSAFWAAALETDADGVAEFTVDMPESLTAWRARVWVMGSETRAGEGECEVVTRKNVLLRPQTPRFLVQKDAAVLSANVHNYLPRALRARVDLALEGGVLEAAEGGSLLREIDLPAGGAARVDWVVRALRPGSARIVMRALTEAESDAAELSLPVRVHGARRVESLGAVLRGGEEGRVIRFSVPESRAAEQSRLEFSFAPGIAAALLPALPYLAEPPYGSTEQELNRFLPALAVREYLRSPGGSGGAAAALRRTGEGSGIGAGAQSAWRETFGDARGEGAQPLALLGGEALDRIAAEGMDRLAGMQNPDGGWGWFAGAGERSGAHTTAIVVQGLLAAAEAGAAVPAGVLERGLGWLAAHQAEQIALLAGDQEEGSGVPRKARADDMDAFAHWILTDAGRGDARMGAFLYRDRLQLSLTGLTLLGLALDREGRGDEAGMVLRNLRQFAEVDAQHGTAWLRVPARAWWLWQNDAVETQAWYLRLLTRLEPESDLAAGVAKYLLENRRNGGYWRSTRDTAFAVRALVAYAAAVGDAAPDMAVRVYYDGKKVLERRIAGGDLFADNRFVLEGLAVEAGDHEIRVEREGAGAVYCAGSLSVFSLDDPIAAAGSDLRVARTVYRLTPAEKAVDLRAASGSALRVSSPEFVREELAALSGVVKTGDLLEAELRIVAANDYEYLVFEDMKAAGLEAVELLSGYGGNSLGAHVEYRDEKVALFVRSLPRGEHRLSYRFRAETPGAFSALPVFGGGMYAPELFCNSDEGKVRIAEEGVFE